MGEHPLDPVGGFAHVLQNQDGAAQIGQVGCAQQVGGHGEIGRQQRPFGAAANPALTLQGGEGFAEQHGPQPLLAPGGLGPQGGQQGAVDGAALALGQLGPEQGGDVGKAQQPAAGQGQGLLQQASRAPAPAHAGQQVGAPPGGGLQVAAPLLIAAGQVAPAPPN